MDERGYDTPVDLYLEGRAMFAADNFNGCEYDNPFDIIGTAMAGLTFNFGGRNFDYVNPCDYLDYINNLNNRINGLRGEIASTAAALAACEAQLLAPKLSLLIAQSLLRHSLLLFSSRLTLQRLVAVKRLIFTMWLNG